MTTLEKIKLQKEYKGKRASVQGASTIAKVRLLREAKEILAQLKGTGINLDPAVFTIQQVSAAMSQTGIGTLWYDDPSINNPINYGVQQGWLYRPSTTQVEWTEEGVALSRAASDPQPEPESEVVPDPEPTTPQNQKLTDLLSGKYDDLQPEAYLKVVQDIIIEINAVDPVKPALLSYLDKAKAKGLITESAAAAFKAILARPNGDG